MDKRVLLTVVLCMGILFVWTKFFMPPPTPAQQQAQQQQAKPGEPPKPGEAKPGEAKPGEAPKPDGTKPSATPTDPQKPSEAEKQAEAPKPEAPKPAEELATIERPGRYKAVFTTWGAAPKEWVLLDKQFRMEVTGPDGKKTNEQINLVKTVGSSLPLITTFPQSDFQIEPDAAWTRQQAPEGELVYTWENDKVRIEKRYSFPAETFEVKLVVTLENKSDKAIAEHMQLIMTGHQDPKVQAGGMFSQRTIQTEGMCNVNGKLKHGDLKSLLEKPIDETGQVRWIGADEKYFLAAVAQLPNPSESTRCWVSGTQFGKVEAAMLTAERKIDPKAKTSYELAGFFGPKFLHELDAVRVAGQDAHLGDAINYGWTEAIARPMLAVLKAVHLVIPNWGLAIIVLTILLKAITWWPTTKSMRSMREMAKLKPEIDKLKAKYGDDKQKFNLATMELYKQKGISPLGGCLPMLIQMPIYIALYAMLGNSVELFHSGFLGWMTDLTAPDRYLITPILTGVLMFAQQKTQPTPADPQQKMMQYMMPVMFTVFSLFLPAGLTIYILTNTLLTMAQQLWMNRQDGPLGRTPAAKPAKA